MGEKTPYYSISFSGGKDSTALLAAEKHFEKKRLDYEKRIKGLNEQLDTAHRDTRYFRSQAEFRERESTELRNCIKWLLEHTELSKEEKMQLCKEQQSQKDPVNNPAHYTDGNIEVIDFIEDKRLGFHLGNAIKYICRAGKKDPEKTSEDLEKAIWYIRRHIKSLTSTN